MKKCVKCDIIFYLDPRQYCLYCDSLLQNIGREVSASLAAKMSRDKTLDPHQRTQYIVGSYFKVRSLAFIYWFNRSQMRFGKEFERVLVQPLDYTSILKLPWVIVDLIDSLFFPFVYSNYCEKCNWKYFRKSKDGKSHAPDECAYNQEYSTLIDEI